MSFLVTGKLLLFIIHAFIISIEMQYEKYASKNFFPQEAQKCSREHKTQSKQSCNYKYGVTKHNLKKKKRTMKLLFPSALAMISYD